MEVKSSKPDPKQETARGATSEVEKEELRFQEPELKNETPEIEFKNQERKDEEPAAEDLDESMKYKGFLYIKCPECGMVKGFNMKYPSDHYHCDSCGARSEFKDQLVPMWVNCECGGRFRYMTNMEEPIFDVNCLNCGAPVAIQWNEKKKIYETVQR